MARVAICGDCIYWERVGAWTEHGDDGLRTFHPDTSGKCYARPRIENRDSQDRACKEADDGSDIGPRRSSSGSFHDLGGASFG